MNFSEESYACFKDFLSQYQRLPPASASYEDKSVAEDIFKKLLVFNMYFDYLSHLSYVPGFLQDVDEDLKNPCHQLFTCLEQVKTIIEKNKHKDLGPRTYNLLKGLYVTLNSLENELLEYQNPKNSKEPNDLFAETLLEGKALEIIEELISFIKAEHPTVDMEQPLQKLTLEEELTYYAPSERYDSLGEDPFNLRDYACKNERNGEFKGLVTEISGNTKEGCVAKVIHTIWLGGIWPPHKFDFNTTESPETIQNSLATSVNTYGKFAPDYKHILWIDADTDEPRLQNWCRENNVRPLRVQDHFPKKDDPIECQLYELYLNERLRQNYGAASDILRLMILRSELRGMYIDVDISLQKKIGDIEAPSGMRINVGTLTYADKGTFENAICNDIMMASKSADALNQLDNLCKELIRTYHLSYKEMYKQTTFDGYVSTGKKLLNYSNNDSLDYRNIPYFYLFKTWAVEVSGPKLLYKTLIRDEQLPGIVVPTDYFLMQNINSWLTKNDDDLDPYIVFKFHNRTSAIQAVITMVLTDLKREERVLRLDNYANSFKYCVGDYSTILNLTFNWLVRYTPEKLHEVQYINKFFETCLSVENVITILNDEKDRKVFKNLDYELFKKELVTYLQSNKDSEIAKDIMKLSIVQDVLPHKRATSGSGQYMPAIYSNYYVKSFLTLFKSYFGLQSSASAVISSSAAENQETKTDRISTRRN